MIRYQTIDSRLMIWAAIRGWVLRSKRMSSIPLLITGVISEAIRRKEKGSLMKFDLRDQDLKRSQS
jgi:uncharacterized protein (UPF0548 family)